jgi:hypothetical protein
VRSAVRAHHRGGPGPEGGRATDDLVCDLFVVLMEVSSKALPGGWASRPFTDYAVWKLHREIIDWYRQRFPGSRYGRALELVGYELPPERSVIGGDERNAVDVGALSVSARWTYFALALPMAREGLSAADVAALARPVGEEHPRLRHCRGDRERVVHRLLRELRAELEVQGARPVARSAWSGDAARCRWCDERLAEGRERQRGACSSACAESLMRANVRLGVQSEPTESAAAAEEEAVSA